MRQIERRAETVRAPEPTRALQRARVEKAAAVRLREALERRSMVRGLLVLAVVVLLASFARAGLERVFVAGWWRQW
jgi:hypothetical protein